MANGMNESAHVAVVLAAGGSRRLGQPKQLLQRGGETLVHRTVRLAAATAPRRLVVVVGAYCAEITALLHELACEFVVNEKWEQGLASTLRCASRALDGFEGPILILGCDQPALELTHLQRLLLEASRATSGCAATVHGEALGIPSVVSPQLLSEPHAMHGDAGLRARLNAIGREKIAAIDAPELCFDLDTPEDLRAAMARGLIDVDDRANDRSA